METLKNIFGTFFGIVLAIIIYAAPVAGVVGHFCGITLLVYIGAIIHIIETFIEYGRGMLSDSSYALMWMTVIIAAIVSLVIKCNVWYGICFALCIEGAFFSIMVVISTVSMFLSEIIRR